MKTLISTLILGAGLVFNSCNKGKNIYLYSQNETLLNKLHFIEYNDKNILIVPNSNLQASIQYTDENKDHYPDYKVNRLYGPKALPINGPKQRTLSNNERESYNLFTKSNSTKFILNEKGNFVELK